MEQSKKISPEVGRARSASSMNALRIGVYSNALLPGESQEQVDEMVDELMRSWPGDGAEQLLSAQIYVQSALKSSRLHAAEVALTNARMHSMAVRDVFCNRVGIPMESAKDLPDWYFDSEASPRDEAVRLGRVVAQAERLLGSSMMVFGAGVRDLLPDLWAEVMGPTTLVSKITLVEKLCQRYPLGKPDKIVNAFIEDYRERFPYELLWAKHHLRFEAILAGIRADIVIEVGTREGWQKADSLLHRRRLELSQHVHTLARQRALLEPTLAVQADFEPPRLAKSHRARAKSKLVEGATPAAVQDVEHKPVQGPVT